MSAHNAVSQDPCASTFTERAGLLFVLHHQAANIRLHRCNFEPNRQTSMQGTFSLESRERSWLFGSRTPVCSERLKLEGSRPVGATGAYTYTDIC